MCQKFRSYSMRGLLTVVFLGALILLLALPAGIALAGDVTSAEAKGQLGLGVADPETPVSEAPRPSAEGSPEVPWLETIVYIVAASLVFAGFALAARRVPWLRRRRRKP